MLELVLVMGTKRTNGCDGFDALCDEANVFEHDVLVVMISMALFVFVDTVNEQTFIRLCCNFSVFTVKQTKTSGEQTHPFDRRMFRLDCTFFDNAFLRVWFVSDQQSAPNLQSLLPSNFSNTDTYRNMSSARGIHRLLVRSGLTEAAKFDRRIQSYTVDEHIQLRTSRINTEPSLSLFEIQFQRICDSFHSQLTEQIDTFLSMVGRSSTPSGTIGQDETEDIAIGGSFPGTIDPVSPTVLIGEQRFTDLKTFDATVQLEPLSVIPSSRGFYFNN